MKAKNIAWTFLALMGWTLLLAQPVIGQDGKVTATAPPAQKVEDFQEYKVVIEWMNTPGQTLATDTFSLTMLATTGSPTRSRETMSSGETKNMFHEFVVEPKALPGGKVLLSIDGLVQTLEGSSYRIHEFSESPVLQLGETKVIRGLEKKTGTAPRQVLISVTVTR